MVDRATQSIASAGTTATYNQAAAGDRFAPAPGTFLHVKNGSGSSINATIVTPATSDGLAVADLVVAVPAGGDRFIRPPANRLVEDVDGLASVTWSATTTVTWAVLHAGS